MFHLEPTPSSLKDTLISYLSTPDLPRIFTIVFKSYCYYIICFILVGIVGVAMRAVAILRSSTWCVVQIEGRTGHTAMPDVRTSPSTQAGSR
jgi:hypothetical protein